MSVQRDTSAELHTVHINQQCVEYTSFFVIIPMYVHIFVVAKKHITKVHPVPPCTTNIVVSPQVIVADNLQNGVENISSASSSQQQQAFFSKSPKTNVSESLLKYAFRLRRQGPQRVLHLVERNHHHRSPLATVLLNTRRLDNNNNTVTWPPSRPPKPCFLSLSSFWSAGSLLWWAFWCLSSAKSCANTVVVLIATVFICLGSALNPFVYWIRLKVFRDEMKRILSRGCFAVCYEW